MTTSNPTPPMHGASFLQQARRFVQVERVNGSYGQMNLILKQRTQTIGVRPNDRGDVVLFPRSSNVSIDIASIAIEE